MINLNSYIEKTAVKNMRFKKVANEFYFLLIIFIVLKLLTSFVSIIAGYSYLFQTTEQIIKNTFISGFIAAFGLIIIEFITQISLQRLFKFALKKQYKFFVIIFVVVGLFFFLSTYISVNGIALISNKKTDNSKKINKEYEANKTAIIKEYETKKDYQKEQVKLLSSQTWKGKLSYKYIKKIDKINDEVLSFESKKQKELTQLKKDYQNKLSKNNIKTDVKMKNYIKIVLIIMLLQFFTNAFLNYFYLLIYKEKNEYLNDFITTEQSKIKIDVLDLYKSIFSINSNAILTGLQRSIIENKEINEPLELTAKYKTPGKENPEHENPEQTEIKKGFGFVIPETEKNEFETLKNSINENRLYENRINENRINENGIRICKNCGKTFVAKHHKQLYCSTACRVQFWEKKTGKKLKFKTTSKK